MPKNRKKNKSKSGGNGDDDKPPPSQQPEEEKLGLDKSGQPQSKTSEQKPYQKQKGKQQEQTQAPEQTTRSQESGSKEKKQHQPQVETSKAWGRKEAPSKKPESLSRGQSHHSQSDLGIEKQQQPQAGSSSAWGKPLKPKDQPQPGPSVPRKETSQKTRAESSRDFGRTQEQSKDTGSSSSRDQSRQGQGGSGAGKHQKSRDESSRAKGQEQPSRKEQKYLQSDVEVGKRQQRDDERSSAWKHKAQQEPELLPGKKSQMGPSGSGVEKRQPQPETSGAWGQKQQPPKDPAFLSKDKSQGQSAVPWKQEPKREEKSLSSPFSSMDINPQVAANKLYYQTKNIPLDRGTIGRPIVLETNYVELVLNNMKDYAYHYHVEIDPDKPKKFMRIAFEEYRKQAFPKELIGFDGKSNAYSSSKLNPANLRPLEVNVVSPDSLQTKVYKVCMKETQDSLIELKSLRNYHSTRIFDKPMRALQCLEVILSSPCHNKGVRSGRSFYVPPSNRNNANLEDGYELWLGLFQAPILGDRPFLNIDVSHKAFPSPTNLIEVVKKFRGYKDGYLDQRDYRTLHDFLNELNVAYTPPPNFGATKKIYKYNALKGQAREESFQLEDGKRVTIEQYYKSKNCPLRYPNLPVLHVGSTVRNILLPLEFCSLEQGQVTNKQCGDRQIRNMIRFAATSTDIRKEKIMNLFNYFQHNGNPIIKQFGIQLGCSFQKINGRILGAPAIEYGDRRQVRPMKGSWRMENVSFLKPKDLLSWRVLICDRMAKENQVRDFADKICSIGKQLKMNLSSSYSVEIEYDTRRLDGVFQYLKTQKVDFVLVVISNFGDGYSKVKQGSELRHGILTQCVKSSTVLNRNNVQTVQNILLKINTKLTGVNHKIATANQTAILSKSIMFVGADVTHPSPGQTTIPSVVGVVASHDLYGTQYNIQYRLQDSKKEIIESMDDILLYHLDMFKKFNNHYPEQIIYYRDGVADGQFPLVSQFEFSAMDKACSRISSSYRPKITCIIVQKRHHTRFFPNKNDGVGKFNNVPPGTVVDKIITHPNESEFFLVSHESIQGTARPAKYCVIRDDARINIDQLQALTFNLCHLFPRCNRSVSYAAPAYLAHLVAARGRVYLEGSRIDTRNLKKEYSTRTIHREIIVDKPMFFV